MVLHIWFEITVMGYVSPQMLQDLLTGWLGGYTIASYADPASVLQTATNII